MTQRQSFVRRLQLGLGALAAVSLLGLAGVVVSEKRAGEALERSQAALALLDDCKEIQIQLAAARAAEREFVLEDLRSPGFFQTGTSPALSRHAEALGKLGELLARLDQEPTADEIRAAVAEYRSSFATLVDLYRRRGSAYTGTLGAMRVATYELQALIDALDEAPRETLRAELLELNGDQSAYLRDLDNRPRFLVGERIEILREEAAALRSGEKAAIETEIGSFDRAWTELLEIDDRIGRSSGAGLRGELRDAEEAVVLLVTNAVTRARDGFEAATASVARTAAAARWTSAGAAALALAIALTVALSLGRYLRSALDAILRAVQQYAAGDRAARVGALPRQDEFAAVAEAFDRMAETLSETTDELEEINASLELAVQGDTQGLLERIKQLVAKRGTPTV